MAYLRAFGLVMLALCVALSTMAQEVQYKFSGVNVNNGLSHNLIKSFLRDRKGFMWIGTLSGLNRFDGYSIKTYRNDPSDPNSVNNSDINSLFEDPDGKIWMTTWTGISIFDPVEETFSHDPNVYLRKLLIPDGTISDIRKDSKGNYWFIHATHGLFKFDPESRRTTPLYNNALDSTSLSSNQIASLESDSEGNLWILHENGVFEKLDGTTLKIVYRNQTIAKTNRKQLLDYRLMVDTDNDVWLYVADRNQGVYYFNAATQFIKRINSHSDSPRLNSDIVKGVVQDNKGLIWVATDHGGINIIDKKDFSVEYILHDPDDNRSLSQNSINTMYKDYDGIVWIGTFKKGVSYYHENIIRFSLYRHQSANPNSLPFNDVNAVAEDKKGNLWIGTNGGGLVYFDRESNTFKQFLHNPKDPFSLSNDVIVSLHLDSSDKLWIGTYYGGLNCYDGRKFIRYRHDPSDPKTISDDNVWEIFEDSQKNLWIGTLNQGVDVFHRERNEFSHYRMGEPNSVHSTYISEFMEDSDGNIWIGTGFGIDVFDRKSNRFIHYLNDRDNPRSLSNNSILSLLQDKSGRIWIGTHGGLNLFDKATSSFYAFKENDGLLHNSVLTIEESADGNLWLGTPHGLSNAIIIDSVGHTLKLEFKNYDESDGLQGKQFNENASLSTSGGELVFGGPNGFNIFRPDKIQMNLEKPSVLISDFQIFNKSVKIGEPVNGRIILSKSIGETDRVILQHSDNVFSIEFVALNFFNPTKSEYKYKLEGFSDEWLTTDGSVRKVTYTNLDPGNYTFRVQASNSDGVWNEEGAILNISVLPPFWKSGAAFVIYIALILGALLLSRQLILARERMRYKIEKERREAQHMHEVDMMKIKFFTNVSHEFRTPLSLILTPLERMLKTVTDPELKKHYQLMHRNARRLLNLVNQLLDFRKLDVQEVKLNLSEGDVVSFLRDVVHSFNDLSEKKHISLSFRSDLEMMETKFDKDKLEKVMFNLLSNAFKFTTSDGKVEVSLSLMEKTEDEMKWVAIRVKDSGIGIPPDKQERVFDRFFQSDVPATMVNQGSGIGLSIAKEFVKLHGGVITVESEEGVGSCFTVLLPFVEISTDGVHAVPVADEDTDINGSLAETSNDSIAETTEKLLLVEDNEDFRAYLRDNLKISYHILEARNGKEGFQLALKYLPDLIVSDIIMPEMDGIELCKKIKTTQTVSHIPLILLTARSSEEQKVEGFEIGADDYITKPFNFEILQSRIRNLIHQRELFQKDFRRQIEVKASDIPITSMDEKLIRNAIACVEEKISDPEFSVEDLSRELGMSRVHLYKKLMALTGKAPLEFIRTIRLQRAAQLLEKSQLTISEVAYSVGFNNPKYFTKYFKEEFGMLPSAYLQEKKRQNAGA